jgi:hypothetical protein
MGRTSDLIELNGPFSIFHDINPAILMILTIYINCISMVYHDINPTGLNYRRSHEISNQWRNERENSKVKKTKTKGDWWASIPVCRSKLNWDERCWIILVSNTWVPECLLSLVLLFIASSRDEKFDLSSNIKWCVMYGYIGMIFTYTKNIGNKHLSWVLPPIYINLHQFTSMIIQNQVCWVNTLR